MAISPDRLGKITRKLALKGYRLTKQRAMTLEVLLEKEMEYLTAEEVFLLTKGKYPLIGIATVYRTLELLSELRIVQKIALIDKSTRFGFRNDESEHRQHHLICHECGLIETVKEDWLLEMEIDLNRKFGFKVLDHSLDFIGTYAVCSENACKKSGLSVS
ncbi:Fur family transcriptional regulator [Paenibacillus tyrfis]|uniref:Fur family transcriptional regulator n=1 Tax=Paenibacillus tyrfis TaxID=1501230 RepID=UPI000B5982A4|nr:transcriptional repressor [Paenibacillus tyrfis]